MAWRDKRDSGVCLPGAVAEPARQTSQAPQPPMQENPPILGEFSMQLPHNFQEELQKALRRELPVALEKELPRALAGGGIPTIARPVQTSSDNSFAESAKTEPEDVPSKTQIQSLRKSVSASSRDSPPMHRKSQDSDDKEVRLGCNRYRARKYFGEFGDQAGDPGDRVRGSLDEHPIRRSMRISSASRRSSQQALSVDSSPRPLTPIQAVGELESNTEDVETSALPPFRKAILKSSSVTKFTAPEDIRSGMVHRVQNELSASMSKLHQSAGDKHLGRLQVMAISIVEMDVFTILTSLLIVLNAVIIGAQTEWMAQTRDSVAPFEFKFIELCFCLCFAVELALRITAYRWLFCIIDWRWNLFDTTLVLTQVIEIILEFGLSNGGPNVSFMRILRILRLVRVMRLVRIVRYISELRTIIASVFNSLRALFFTCLLIAFIIYIVSIALTQLVTEHAQGSDNPMAKEELSEHFGSVPWTSLVLFQSITNGIDWADISTPLAKHISPLMAPMLCIFIAFSQFAMLNVITGVFVERALAEDAEEKDAYMVSRLVAFLSISEHPGYITWDEFEERLDDTTIQLYFKTMDLDPCEARGLFMLLDSDENGTVDAEEFIMGCLRLRGTAKAIDLATLMYENRRWFRRFEKLLLRLETASCGTASGRLPRADCQKLSKAIADSRPLISDVSRQLDNIESTVPLTPRSSDQGSEVESA